MIPLSIEAKDISKDFGRVPALSKVNFTCHAGEIMILLGANGAGKTTFLRILAGLTKPSSGSLIFPNEAVFKDPVSLKKQIGFAGSTPYLYQDLTAEENLLFFAKLFEVSDPKERIGKIIEGIGLTHYIGRPVKTLSKGIQQRINLARIFLYHPGILLLDEPHAHLDQASSCLLNEKLIKHSREGGLAIMATHQTDLIETLGNRCIILNRGKIIFDQINSQDSIQEAKKIYEGLS